ncbi:MAG TPA: hypothetical protein VNU44_14135, partial [Bryobacteraceae bacterium]|nr:hypothetical protein [Bryobacteraceae bacterium]
MRLLGDIKEISAERNKWIHGFFSDSGTENEKRTLSHPKWQRSLTLDSAEITPLIDRMINASKRLGQLADLAQERLQILNRVIRQMETDDADLHRPED